MKKNDDDKEVEEAEENLNEMFKGIKICIYKYMLYTYI